MRAASPGRGGATDVKNRLKVLRAERDWTQEMLADRLGVTRHAIMAIESGKYNPSLPLAMKIAALAGKPVEQIFTLEDGD